MTPFAAAPTATSSEIADIGWSEVWACLSARFPSVPPQSVLTILLDARHAVELFGRTGPERFAAAERIALAQLNALVDDLADQPVTA